MEHGKTECFFPSSMCLGSKNLKKEQIKIWVNVIFKNTCLSVNIVLELEELSE